MDAPADARRTHRPGSAPAAHDADHATGHRASRPDSGARALHEALSQTLFAARLLTDQLVRQAERDQAADPRWLQAARTLERLNHGALAELQALHAELHPAAVAPMPVAARLRPLLQALQCRGDIVLQATLAPTDALRAGQRRLVLRFVQAALAHASHHSGCRRITLRWEPAAAGGPLLHIGDDGCGYEPARHPGHQALAAHARALRARLTLDSHPGAGTRLTLQLPPARRARGPRPAPAASAAPTGAPTAAITAAVAAPARAPAARQPLSSAAPAAAATAPPAR